MYIWIRVWYDPPIIEKALKKFSIFVANTYMYITLVSLPPLVLTYLLLGWHLQAVRATETQVLVAVLGDKLAVAAELVSEFWDVDIKAEYKVHKKVMKHIEYAIDSKIPWMVIVGERELNEGIVKLKNIETATEEAIPRSNLVGELQQRLKLNP